MAIMLMNLRNVPEDEVEELRDLLKAHHIDFYETEPNRWGISMGAIWLRDEARRDEARHLIDRYQQQRRTQAREDYEHRRRTGKADTFIGRVRRHPVQTLIYLGIVALILYLSTTPFVSLGSF